MTAITKAYQKRMKRKGWKPCGWVCSSGETISYDLSVGAGDLASAVIRRDTKETGGWFWYTTGAAKDREPWHPTPDSAADAAEYALRKLLETALEELPKDDQ
jgi:hypothetical protein